MVALPEYNGFASPLLLNVYMWCSCGDKDMMYTTFCGKTALIMGAWPGAMGHLLQNLNVHVLSNTVAIGGAFNAVMGIWCFG